MSSPEIEYARAPAGSPDNYVLTEDAVYVWVKVPRWIWSIVVAQGAVFSDGHITAYMSPEAQCALTASVYKGFFFDVSVAPSFKGAMGGANLHDFIYGHSEALAKLWNCTVRDVLAIADHWFLANMRASDFLLARTYFSAVRVLGYGFHRLSSLFKS